MPVRPLIRQKIPFVKIWTRLEAIGTTIDRVNEERKKLQESKWFLRREKCRRKIR
jgi:hypothetical protein